MKAKLYEAYGIELPDAEDETPDPEPGDGVVLDVEAGVVGLPHGTELSLDPARDGSATAMPTEIGASPP